MPVGTFGRFHARRGFLSYYYYATATLVVKAMEGLIVGFLIQRQTAKGLKQWKIFIAVIGLGLGFIVWILGKNIYSGPAETTVGFPQIGTSILCTFFAILILGFKVDYTLGWMVLSVLLGGLEMIDPQILPIRTVLPRLLCLRRSPHKHRASQRRTPRIHTFHLESFPFIPIPGTARDKAAFNLWRCRGNPLLFYSFFAMRD